MEEKSPRESPEERSGEVTKAFREAFQGAEPTHLSRAPGRVNLIGEHTDYNGLPVFPMALRQEVNVHFRPRQDGLIRFVNPVPEFPPRSFQLSGDIPKDPTGDWGNYLKAPCQALVRTLGPLRGMDAFLTSSVPVASGLSSSSALVIAVGKALLHANEMEAPILELAEEMAAAERYTGTQGGGMDQAISLGAVAGHASRIEFDPLSLQKTPVPPGWHFVVGHTLVRAEKSGGAQATYNQRREECDQALSGMAPALYSLGSKADGPGSLQEFPAASRTHSDAGPEEEYEYDYPIPTYRELIPEYALEDLLGLAEAGLPSPLLRRFRHVVTEAARVYAAEAAMKANDLLTFGILMDASHESLRTDYEVSSPELDRLVELARSGGAAGARLTGAGFGGCMVALTDEDHLEKVLASLRTYYSELGFSGRLSHVLFRAEPSEGASVHSL